MEKLFALRMGFRTWGGYSTLHVKEELQSVGTASERSKEQEKIPGSAAVMDICPLPLLVSAVLE